MTRPRNTSPSGGVVRNVQVLRAFAAFLVVFVHLDRLLSWLGLPPFGAAGVDIFFVISGFIMVYTTVDREIRPWSFMADRIARIVPPYWAVTLAVFIVALAAPTLLQATRGNWTELSMSLAFIPFEKANGLVEPMLFVGWTLNYEMFFYLLFAIGLAIPNKVLGVTSVIFYLVCLVGVGLAEQPQEVLGRFYTNTIMLDFAFGMVIGLTHRQIPNCSATSVKLATAVLVCFAAGATVLLPLFLPKVPSFAVCGLPASLVVGGALALERWGWTVRTRWCLRLGNASYSIYLIHPFVTQLAQRLAAGMQPNGLTAFTLIAVTLVSVGMAGLTVHHLLERPLSNMLRRLLKARRLNPQAA
jgi:exopolysaccharide production protein ExoZ